MNNECQKNQVAFRGNNKALRKYERTSHKENPKWKSTETSPRRIALFLAFLWPILSIFITYQIADPSKGWYDYVSWHMCMVCISAISRWVTRRMGTLGTLSKAMEI